ncbi:hypothetical protein sos41_17770 [Alphaproteobacteria bacterium SO-S41]|nr:hypothetical protein sos41_17770 [Alphaproteobacteria bacterium SO-S41]
MTLAQATAAAETAVAAAISARSLRMAFETPRP